MTPYQPPIRPELIGEEPYGAPVLDVPVRLNVNENPLGPDPELVAALAREIAAAAPMLNRYPDRDAVALRGDLADYLGHGLGAADIWVGNGSNEVMAHLFRAFGGPDRSALTFTPTYSMYPEYARNSYTRYLTEGLPDDFVLGADLVRSAIAQHTPALTLIASPNNPTGMAVSNEVVAVACAATSGIVVVDEAYAEFRRDGTPSALALLAAHPNLVVTRTMSKAFAFAGGRLGYLAAHPAVVEALRVVRLPYHLSALTQVAARTALAHRASLLRNVDLLRAERDRMAVWLLEQGLRVYPSDANFLLTGPFADREDVWRRLVDHGVLVRVVGPTGYLRISIGTAEENLVVREALSDVLEEQP